MSFYYPVSRDDLTLVDFIHSDTKMSISIYYQGTIDQIADVAVLSEEVTDFASILGWEIRRWNGDWARPNTAALAQRTEGFELTGHVPLRGVSLLADPDCEPLFLTFNKKGALEKLFHQLEKKQKQLDVLLKYLQEVPIFKDANLNTTGIDKQNIANSGISKSALNTLIKNDILEEFEITISRLQEWQLQEVKEVIILVFYLSL